MFFAFNAACQSALTAYNTDRNTAIYLAPAAKAMDDKTKAVYHQAMVAHEASIIIYNTVTDERVQK